MRARYHELAGQEAAAEREFEEAVRLEARSIPALYSYGRFAFRQGRLERAAELWEKALEVDPDAGPGLITMLPQVYSSVGREDDAMRAYERQIEWATRRLTLHPDDTHARISGAIGLFRLGQKEESLEWMRLAEESAVEDSDRFYNIACFYSLAGEVDRAFDALERSIESGKTDIEWLLNDSDLDNLRDDARFKDLLEVMKSRS